jgi:hypothetical protein
MPKAKKPKITDPFILRMRATRGMAARIASCLGTNPRGKPYSRTCVYEWTKVPDRHVRTINKSLRIPLREMRPDLFGELASS